MITRKKTQRGFTLIELMIVVAIVGILAVLAVFGVRRYLSNAKSAEASNSLGMMNQGAVAAYEQETTPSELVQPGSTSTTAVHQLCKGATQSVPGTNAQIAGVKYVPDTAVGKDYGKDAATAVPTGFACLRFEINQPQFYQYCYGLAAGPFAAACPGHAAAAGGAPNAPPFGANSWGSGAFGDLNGDGKMSAFITGGDTTSTRAVPFTTIATTDPEE